MQHEQDRKKLKAEVEHLEVNNKNLEVDNENLVKENNLMKAEFEKIRLQTLELKKQAECKDEVSV